MLIAVTAVAPPRSAARPRATASAVFGVIFAKTGIWTDRTTARTTRSTSAGSEPTSEPSPFAWGQLRLSSSAWTPVPAMVRETSANPSASPAKTEPTIGTPAARAMAISRGYSPIPGFGSPIAFSIPQVPYASIVGFG